MCRALNHDTPRPGQIYHIPITSGADDTIIVEAVMPGVDFDSAGITKVDFQMWPLFQALDIDHVLTCIEVSWISQQGRDRLTWRSHYQTLVVWFSARNTLQCSTSA